MGSVRDVFGKRLKELRDNRGLTIAKAASEIGIIRQSLSRYEAGTIMPDIEVLCMLAKFYNVSTDYLVGMSDCSSLSTDMQSICNYTGLSEEAAKKLSSLKKIKPYYKGLSEQVTEYEISATNILNDLIVNIPISFFCDISELHDRSQICIDKTFLIKGKRANLIFQEKGFDVGSVIFKKEFSDIIASEVKTYLEVKLMKRGEDTIFSYCDWRERYNEKCDALSFRIVRCFEDFLKRYDLRQPIEKMSDSEFLEYLGITDEDIEFLRECITEREEENHVQHPQTNE